VGRDPEKFGNRCIMVSNSWYITLITIHGVTVLAFNCLCDDDDDDDDDDEEEEDDDDDNDDDDVDWWWWWLWWWW